MGEHDENITFERTVEMIGLDWPPASATFPSACTARRQRLRWPRGIIIADTKFEFGLTPTAPWC